MSDIIDRLAHRVKGAIVGALVKAVIDTGEIQLVKIAGRSGEVQDGIERLQNYGMSSNPPVDSEAVAACIGGSKDHVVVIVVDSGANRPTGLATGETCFYSMFGQQTTNKADGSVHVSAPAGTDHGNGTSPVALSSAVDELWSKLYDVFVTSWVPVAQDGGAALKTAFMAEFGTPPSSTASTNLRAD